MHMHTFCPVQENAFFLPQALSFNRNGEPFAHTQQTGKCQTCMYKRFLSFGSKFGEIMWIQSDSTEGSVEQSLFYRPNRCALSDLEKYSKPKQTEEKLLLECGWILMSSPTEQQEPCSVWLLAIPIFSPSNTHHFAFTHLQRSQHVGLPLLLNRDILLPHTGSQIDFSSKSIRWK